MKEAVAGFFGLVRSVVLLAIAKQKKRPRIGLSFQSRNYPVSVAYYIHLRVQRILQVAETIKLPHKACMYDPKMATQCQLDFVMNELAPRNVRDTCMHSREHAALATA